MESNHTNYSQHRAQSLQDPLEHFPLIHALIAESSPFRLTLLNRPRPFSKRPFYFGSVSRSLVHPSATVDLRLVVKWVPIFVCCRCPGPIGAFLKTGGNSGAHDHRSFQDLSKWGKGT